MSCSASRPATCCRSSMERASPIAGLTPHARIRLAATATEAVSELVQKFLFMKQMMGNLGQNMGMMGKIPGMKQLAQANQLSQGVLSLLR